MQVQINDLMSTVQAVDVDMEKIARVVLQAVNDQQAHARRVRAETRVTGGVAYEMEEEDR